jgi:hypothetical protein
MKRLVRSTKTGIFCTQCDKSIPVNTSRIIDGGMHSHYECLNKGKIMSDWISREYKLPCYGVPVLIVVGGVTQSETFILDGYDEVEDWFEPFHTDQDIGRGVFASNVTHWMPSPKPLNY